MRTQAYEGRKTPKDGWSLTELSKIGYIYIYMYERRSKSETSLGNV